MSTLPFFVCNIEALFSTVTFSTVTCFGEPLPLYYGLALQDLQDTQDIDLQDIDICICIANVALIIAPILVATSPRPPPTPPPPPPPLPPIFLPLASLIPIRSLAEIFPTVDDPASCKEEFDLLEDFFVHKGISGRNWSVVPQSSNTHRGALAVC